ncbi:MAG: hypothetical protein K0R09_2646 [Clostridiales bacterium]|nr:hypothetical protein [Clostridiales bacterium]
MCHLEEVKILNTFYVNYSKDAEHQGGVTEKPPKKEVCFFRNPSLCIDIHRMSIFKEIFHGIFINHVYYSENNIEYTDNKATFSVATEG